MPRKKTDSAENVDFEAAIEQLDTIVTKMEAGGLSLEDSLEKFEQGIKLTRHCQQALKQAEQKVKVLLEKNGKIELTPFELDEDDENDDD